MFGNKGLEDLWLTSVGQKEVHRQRKGCKIWNHQFGVSHWNGAFCCSMECAHQACPKPELVEGVARQHFIQHSYQCSLLFRGHAWTFLSFSLHKSSRQEKGGRSATRITVCVKWKAAWAARKHTFQPELQCPSPGIKLRRAFSVKEEAECLPPGLRPFLWAPGGRWYYPLVHDSSMTALMSCLPEWLLWEPALGSL